MQEYINECMTVRNKLLAINEPVPDRQFTHKLLNVDKELYHVRATLAHANQSLSRTLRIAVSCFLCSDGYGSRSNKGAMS